MTSTRYVPAGTMRSALGFALTTLGVFSVYFFLMILPHAISVMWTAYRLSMRVVAPGPGSDLPAGPVAITYRFPLVMYPTIPLYAIMAAMSAYVCASNGWTRYGRWAAFVAMMLSGLILPLHPSRLPVAQQHNLMYLIYLCSIMSVAFLAGDWGDRNKRRRVRDACPTVRNEERQYAAPHDEATS